MSRSFESRPLLYVFVGLFSLAVHIPILMGAGLLFPPSDETLTETYTIEPLQLIEDDPITDEEDPPQVVSLDKPEVETPPPDKATALDRYNQKADQETVRKRDGRSLGTPTPIKPPKRKQPKRAAVKKTPTETPKSTEVKADDTEDKAALPDEQSDKNRAIDAQSDTPKTAPKEGLADRAEATPTENENANENAPDQAESDTQDSNGEENPDDIDFSKLMPNMRNTIGEGGSGVKDYLEIPEGEKDLLNRKETRYWAFFDRLKGAVRRQWKPNQIYRSHDPRGQIYGVQDRLTIVRVTLRGDGSLKEMYVEKPSGLAFLDDEAVRAFRSAQPFPNPPEGLKDDNGHIKFSFGFMFEIHSRVSRIIRYRR